MCSVCKLDIWLWKLTWSYSCFQWVVLWSCLCTVRVSLTDDATCMDLINEFLLSIVTSYVIFCHCNFLLCKHNYITYCMSDWKQWRSQPKNWGGKNFWRAKMLDFRWITQFCLEKRVSKHKITIFSKNLGAWPLCSPPGYAYDWKISEGCQ